MSANGSRPTRRGRAKWLVLGLLGAALYVALKTGWAGFGWAQLRSRVLPRDDGLLEWIPPETDVVAIIDPHQLNPAALGPPQSVARTALVRARDDIKTATGVDLAFDVDKAALTPNLVVLQGRFDSEKLGSRLADHKYVKASYGGRVYLVRAGEDAVMVVDDGVLIYGDEASIKAAADAQLGRSLAKDEKVTERLAQMGWNQPLIGTVRLSDDRPSVRAMIIGTPGARAVTIGVRVARGVDVRGSIEVGTASAAERLEKLLEDKRGEAAEALQPTTGTELGALLADVAKGATIRAETTGQVTVQAHIPSDAVDALIKAARASGPLMEASKTVRLFQLPAPGP